MLHDAWNKGIVSVSRIHIIIYTSVNSTLYAQMLYVIIYVLLNLTCQVFKEVMVPGKSCFVHFLPFL